MATELTKGDAVKWSKADSIVRKGAAVVFEVGRALLQIKDNEWYLAEFATFEDYLEDVGFEPRSTRRWIRSSKVVDNIENAETAGQPCPASPAFQSQCEPLAKLAPEDQAPAWQEACERAKAEGKQQPPARVVAEVVAEIKEAEAAESEDKPPFDVSEPVTESEGARGLREVGEWYFDLFASMGQLASLVKKAEERWSEPPDGVDLHEADVLLTDLKAIVGDRSRHPLDLLQAIRANINLQRPSMLCPDCEGEGCGHCKSRGWVTKKQAEAAKLRRESVPA